MTVFYKRCSTEKDQQNIIAMISSMMRNQLGMYLFLFNVSPATVETQQKL